MKGSIDAFFEIVIHLSINSRLVLGFFVTKIPMCEIFAAIGFLTFSFDLYKAVTLSNRFVTNPSELLSMENDSS